jgi:hypothetical protein
MTTEQFLAYTSALEWSTAEDIAAYLDALGLWPEDTPAAVKVRDVDRGLRATDPTGWPLLARVQRGSGPWLYKQEAAFTAADLHRGDCVRGCTSRAGQGQCHRDQSHGRAAGQRPPGAALGRRARHDLTGATTRSGSPDRKPGVITW